MSNILDKLVDSNIIEIADKPESKDKYIICFYILTDGSVPAKDFLESLTSNKAEKQIAAKLKYYFCEYLKKGLVPKRPEHYSYFRKEGFFELKAYQGRLFCFNDGELCVAVCGYIKKGQKTPKFVIDRVKRYKSEYYKRKKLLG
ncbi:MAG TPA: hypothetical protein HPP87_09010 [Planctomycetes bacterium]|nr:hypothetical protein [Planctomycetota bacterium]